MTKFDMEEVIKKVEIFLGELSHTSLPSPLRRGAGG
jgi:hypothetical protein